MTWLFRFLAITLATLIIVLSLQPFSGAAGLAHVDKVQHFLAYAVLAGLIGLGWPRWRLIRIIIITALIGASVELAQGLLSQGRTASVFDALANLLGAICAAFALYFGRISLRRRNEKMR